MSGWFEETPESLRMLAEERAKLDASEAKYECRRCGKALEPDYGMSDRLNGVRAWLWRRAHKWNCPGTAGRSVVAGAEVLSYIERLREEARVLAEQTTTPKLVGWPTLEKPAPEAD